MTADIDNRPLLISMIVASDDAEHPTIDIICLISMIPQYPGVWWYSKTFPGLYTLMGKGLPVTQPYYLPCHI